MGFEVEIIKDSLAPCNKRLTTFVLTYPRFIHAELMTHRQFSRNASSSRAIPVSKTIRRVEMDPVIPIYWGKNEPGMSANETLSKADAAKAEAAWNTARFFALRMAKEMAEIGLHKQIINRILEPFSWITVIVSSTEWSNFFAQRCRYGVEPHMHALAFMMHDAYQSSIPVQVGEGTWHLPFLDQTDRISLTAERQIKVSVARCARVSYLNHDGKHDIQGDLKLYDKLITGGHWSPFEHQGKALSTPLVSGNFVGFEQYRKTIPGECR